MQHSEVERDDPVTLANWQEPPYNRWAFSHMDQLVPVQMIAGAGSGSVALPRIEKPVGELAVHTTDGAESTVEAVLDSTYTDAVMLIHGGEVVYERYFGETGPTTPHLLMSVTKSVVGCVAGILIDQGAFADTDHVSKWIPELTHSGYQGATVRNILDMRSAVYFSEEYTNSEAEVRVMEEAMGWSPTTHRDLPKSMYHYLTTLSGSGEHGGAFQYRSCETDVLGWLCERATGRAMPDLISSTIWVPIGAESDAEMTCDSHGATIHDGGMCTTVSDLARFGLMLLNHGTVGEVRVVPEEWLRSAWAVDPDIREAFDQSDAGPYVPGGWYRNQFWFMPRHHGDVLVCLGINGQMLYVNPGTGLVAAKLSTWPEAQSAHMLHDTLRAFDSVGATLAGLTLDGANREGPPGIAAGLSR